MIRQTLPHQDKIDDLTTYKLHLCQHNLCIIDLVACLLIYTEFYFFTSPSVAIDTLYELYLHFCYELTSAKCSIKSLRVHDFCRAHLLVSLQWSELLTSKCFSRLKTVNSARNGVPKEAEEPYLRPFVSRREPVPTNVFLQPVKAAAMCMAPCAETRPPPPIPPFLLAKNQNGLHLLITCGQTTDGEYTVFVISG